MNDPVQPPRPRLKRRTTPAPWATRAAALAEPHEAASDELFVEAFARGLAVIRSFANRQQPLTIAEVSRRASVSRSAARRLLRTLVTLGYASMDAQGFSLLPKTLMLGSAFLSSDALVELGRPVINQLAAATQTFCSLNVPQGDESLLACVAYLLQPAEVELADPNIGTGAPMYCSASGLLFLSTFDDDALEAYLGRTPLLPYTYLTTTDPAHLRQRLRQIRADGYATIDREMSLALRAIAVPVRDRSGRMIAALVSMATPQQASMSELLARWLPMLKVAASTLGAQL